MGKECSWIWDWTGQESDHSRSSKTLVGDVDELEGGWKTSEWFGTFRYYEKGWLYHARLGWLTLLQRKKIVYGCGKRIGVGYGRM